jgi:predicted TIM-barrel fold metal-dependent hydrolase
MLHEPSEIIARLATWRQIVGSERILFASDQASGRRFTGERSKLPEWVQFFRDLPGNAADAGYRFTAEEADMILGGNARRFYAMP